MGVGRLAPEGLPGLRKFVNRGGHTLLGGGQYSGHGLARIREKGLYVPTLLLHSMILNCRTANSVLDPRAFGAKVAGLLLIGAAAVELVQFSLGFLPVQPRRLGLDG